MIFTFKDESIGMSTELNLTKIGKEYLIEITNILDNKDEKSTYSVAKLSEEEIIQLDKEIKRLTKN